MIHQLQMILVGLKFNNTGRGKKNLLFEKIRVICIDLTLLIPNMATKMLWHPPLLREKVLKLKTKFLVKKD